MDDPHDPATHPSPVPSQEQALLCRLSDGRDSHEAREVRATTNNLCFSLL